MLEVEGLCASYWPVRAVDGVSLTVPEGTVVAVLGANGAGKTSLLRTISGLLPATAGHVRLAGQDITRAPVETIVRQGLAHVPEGRGVIPELTVEENLRLGGLFRGRDSAPLSEVYELFPRLEERRRQPASRLSGGERQMLSIGRALVGRPRALLLDEPSLGLAPRIVEEIFGIIRRLKEQRELAVLLVEQNATLALDIADHGYVMENGRIVLEGTADSLARNSDIQEFYLGLNEQGARKSYRDIKQYKRRKRWLS